MVVFRSERDASGLPEPGWPPPTASAYACRQSEHRAAPRLGLRGAGENRGSRRRPSFFFFSNRIVRARCHILAKKREIRWGVARERALPLSWHGAVP